MEKKYFYFQPQYVNEFKCDGSKCDAHCCNEMWNISIDKETYKLYSQEITSHIKFNSDKDEYFIDFGEKKFCPFLTENKLCRLQLEHGEKFLSMTCATYPRITNSFEYFFERSLILSCPVAAEMILFECEPMKFEFVQVPEKIHSLDGKFFFQKIQATEDLKKHLIEIQIAMISILQERTLSIDQRLIVLGFFVDRLEEIFSDFDEDALTKLIAAYESKKFLAEQVPLMIQSVEYNEKKFIEIMRDFSEKVFGEKAFADNKNFSETVNEAFPLLSDKKNFVAAHLIFFENFLVNELFLNIFPWKFDGSIAQNFAAFVTEYKFFELTAFSVSLKGFAEKKDLIELAGWFTTRFDHTKEHKRNIFLFIEDKDEPFTLMESLLEGSD
ncbi:MAG: flagellin lysine-N-methylase [Selenomonadaceae bacterium]|nr:flagellin lysine-N-methylase [Selenomonadaceae bacterium]